MVTGWEKKTASKQEWKKDEGRKVKLEKKGEDAMTSMPLSECLGLAVVGPED